MGALTRTHGRTKTREYRIWILMRDRCYTPTHKSYRYYGARGVGVCARWRYDFMAFFADMGPRPSPTHQLDWEIQHLMLGPRNFWRLTGKTWCRQATPEKRGEKVSR